MKLSLAVLDFCLLSVVLMSLFLRETQAQTSAAIHPDSGQTEVGTYLFHACQASIRVMDSQ